MKMFLLAGLLLLSSSQVFAVPTGQQTCNGNAFGKTLVFKYGTYGSSGDATLVIKEKGRKDISYVLAGDYSQVEGENLTFIAKAGQGTISWVGGGDENVDAAFLTVKIDKENTYQAILACKTTKYDKAF